MAEKEKQYWSMTEGVFNCLIDEERSKAFEKAILNTVKKGDVVVDMGTGSGILAMFAVRAGAKKVYAIELDKNNIATLSAIFKDNKMFDKIIIVQGDVTKVDLPEKVDVIIGEMIATALIDELQVPATNNILRFAKENTKVLLREYKTFVDLVYNNEIYHNLSFNLFRYEYPDLKKLKSTSLSEKHLIYTADFTKINKDLKVNKKIEIKIKKEGILNGIRLSGKTLFYDGSMLGATFAYDYPIILPVDTTPVK
ncbi:MAG: 50S ribosomal protein L11 methyltransferase, partial [Candidatus Vogelbacteria bacterium]|nr:50S ribosomal protein L11 methyltransferase [Candidatus Vogelbacteria bacterium]